MKQIRRPMFYTLARRPVAAGLAWLGACSAHVLQRTGHGRAPLCAGCDTASLPLQKRVNCLQFPFKFCFHNLVKLKY